MSDFVYDIMKQELDKRLARRSEIEKEILTLQYEIDRLHKFMDEFVEDPIHA